MPRKHTHRRVRATRPRHDALVLLQADHARITGLFDRFARDGESRLLDEACRALEVHTQIEEEIFYPAVRGELACRDWLEEGEVEHRTIHVLVEELRSEVPGKPRSAATAAVLAELLRRHLEKEERRIFPRVRRARVDLIGLAELLRNRQDDIVGERAARAPRRLNGYSGFAPF